MKRIYITLDTEMDNDEHWGKHFPPTYTSVTEGIPQLLRPIWDKYEVHPIYFVSPEVLYDEASVEVLRTEIHKGALIGAHLHPEYIEPNKTWGKEIEGTAAKFPCNEETTIEREKLRHLTELIETQLGVRPIWYRAARFGLDNDSMKILDEMGYRYDSSVTPGIDWSSKGGPDHRKPIKNDAGSVVIEKPVTIMGKRWGFLGRLLPDNWLFYRWLRPTHMTYLELKHIIDDMIKCQVDEGVMMFHSMEIMINKTPYVRNKLMQSYFLWRLERTLQYAQARGYKL